MRKTKTKQKNEDDHTQWCSALYLSFILGREREKESENANRKSFPLEDQTVGPRINFTLFA